MTKKIKEPAGSPELAAAFKRNKRAKSAFDKLDKTGSEQKLRVQAKAAGPSG